MIGGLIALALYILGALVVDEYASAIDDEDGVESTTAVRYITVSLWPVIVLGSMAVGFFRKEE